MPNAVVCVLLDVSLVIGERPSEHLSDIDDPLFPIIVFMGVFDVLGELMSLDA